MCYGDVPTIHSNINLKLAFENQEYDLLILYDVSRENSVSKYGHSKGVCDLLFCCTWKYTDEWAELWKPWIMENILEWYLWYSPYLLELIDSREILGTGTKSDLLTWQRFRELFLFENFNPCVSAGLFPALTGCGIFTNCNRCQLLDLSCLKDIWMLSKTYSEFLGQ